MTTTSKQLRRKHRKSPKPRKQGTHPSRASGLERLHALEPAYIAWRSRTVPPEQAHDDWAGLLVLLESAAKIGPSHAPDAFDPKSFVLMLKAIRRIPGDTAFQSLNRLDGYLHFLQDNGRWHRGNDVFDVLHMLLLMRVPGATYRRTPVECPIDIPERHCHGLTLVQWAAYLLDEMLEGKFIPGSNESLALPVAAPAGPVLLAPGLYPLPLTVFLNLFTAMGEADLFETDEDEIIWDEDENVEEGGEDDGDLYPTHLGMALLQDDHPRNHDAIRGLLTAYLRTVAMAQAMPASGLAGLRRAERFMSVLGDVATETSTAKAHGETSFLGLGEDIMDRLADCFGEISASILACLEAGALEFADGTLVAQPIVREAIKDLRDEYLGGTPWARKPDTPRP